MKNVGNSSRGRSQGVPKIFRALMYRVHCAVVFAIAQLSCLPWPLYAMPYLLPPEHTIRAARYCFQQCLFVCLSVLSVRPPVWEWPGVGGSTPLVHVFNPPSLIYSFVLGRSENNPLDRICTHCFYHHSTNSVSSIILYPQSGKDA